MLVVIRFTCEKKSLQNMLIVIYISVIGVVFVCLKMVEQTQCGTKQSAVTVVTSLRTIWTYSRTSINSHLWDWDRDG